MIIRGFQELLVLFYFMQAACHLPLYLSSVSGNDVVIHSLIRSFEFPHRLYIWKVTQVP